MSRPQVIDDTEHERVHDKVAAIDVAKDTGMVCTRTPHPSRPGARRSTIWTIQARRNAIAGLGRQLARDGIEVVTLESTSDYWRIWFFVLEACGLAVQLVNASQARNLPGRPKTDKLDAQWLARLTEMGLLRPSFVPPKAIRDLRDYTRARTRLASDRTRCWQRLEKLLEGALISCLGRLQADHGLGAGHDQGHDRRAARPAHAGRPGPHPDESPHDNLVEALDGMFNDHHRGSPPCCSTASPSWTPRSPADRPDRRIRRGDPAGLGHRPRRHHRPRRRNRPRRRSPARPGAADPVPASARTWPAPSSPRPASNKPPPHRRPPRLLGPALPLYPASPAPHPGRKKGQGDGFLRGYLGGAAVAASRAPTFLGERYTRFARRRQRQGPGGHRPVHPGHHRPARRPRRPLRRPWPRLYACRTNTGVSSATPAPPDPGPRVRRDHRPHRLTNTAPD